MTRPDNLLLTNESDPCPDWIEYDEERPGVPVGEPVAAFVEANRGHKAVRVHDDGHDTSGLSALTYLHTKHTVWPPTHLSFSVKFDRGKNL